MASASLVKHPMAGQVSAICPRGNVDRPLMPTLAAVTACVVLALAASVCGGELVIAEGGKSPYRIAIGRDATMQEAYAARMLQRHIKEISGAELTITTDGGPVTEREIVVGSNRHSAELGIDAADFGKEEFRLVRVRRRLVIVGGKPRGVIYGVNSVLVDEWGCRWFAPDVKRIPKQDRLTVRRKDHRYRPPFEWRDTYFWSGLDTEWSLHNFINKRFARLSLEQGGRAGFAHGMHTALQFVPLEKYQATHPEYFSMGTGDEKRAGGSRTPGVCLTHKDIPKVMADAIQGLWTRQHEGDVIYSVSRGDGSGDWCECSECMAFYKKNGGPRVGSGAFAAAWLRLADRVDRELQSRGHDVRIGTLAYGWAAIPPESGPRYSRLNVTYAENNQQCQLHALDDPRCPKNAVSRERLAKWLQYAGSVYIWQYRLSYAGTDQWTKVYPNFHTFAPDLRYLRKVGVKGVYCQGNQGGWWGHRFGGEMNELRAYLLARLMWNPDLDWRKEREEFLAAYYGAEAGAFIGEFLDDVTAVFDKAGVHSYGSGFAQDNYPSIVTPEAIARWYGHVDRAERAAVDDDHKKLVRIARLPIQRTEALIVEDKTKRRELMQAWLDACRKLGAYEKVGEGGSSLRRFAGKANLEWK